MKWINDINDNPLQHHTLITDKGNEVSFTMTFLPRISQWIFDIEYKDLKIYGQPLVLGYNLLRQFMNEIDFGLLVISDDNIDPFRLDDFSKQRVKLCLLNTDDIQLLEVNLYNE